MWIRPSMPSRSTKAPKSTMLEILPSTTWPGSQAAEDLLADLLALLLEHRAAREDDVVARAVELDHLALERLALELVEVVDAADVDQRGGQEAADAEVEDQAALDDLDHAALDRLAGLGRGLDLAPGLLEAGPLLGEDQAALLVLLGEDQRVDLLAERDLLGGIDRAADRELVRRDDALGLVADVDQDLVLVDPDDLAGDHVALLEGLDRRVVVGDELAVDLDQQVGGAAVGGGAGGGLAGASVAASVVVSVADTAADDRERRRTVAPRAAALLPLLAEDPQQEEEEVDEIEVEGERAEDRGALLGVALEPGRGVALDLLHVVGGEPGEDRDARRRW